MFRTLEALNGTGSAQHTDYFYIATTGNGSMLNANNLLSAVYYPDPSTGIASGSANEETFSYDALGETIGYTDRNGTTHEYEYDVLGRKVADIITTLGSGVDGSVMALGWSYGEAGLPYTATTYSDTSMMTAVSQIMNYYNDLEQLVTQYQSDTTVVSPLYPPVGTRYVYSDLSDGNNSRLTQMIYPNGRTVDYTYSTGLDAAISRVDGMADDDYGEAPAASIVSYKYLGLSTIVQESQADGDTLSYIAQSGDSDALPTDTATSGGDRYTGLDRFGRVVDQNWFNSSNGATIARYQYS